jgi:hypothetical protein
MRQVHEEDYQPAAAGLGRLEPRAFLVQSRLVAAGSRAVGCWLVVFLLPFLSAQTSAAQANLTAADYARAESFLMDSVLPYVSGIGVQPVWLSGNRVAYRNPTRGAAGIILVDPARGSRVACNPDTDRCGGGTKP